MDEKDRIDLLHASPWQCVMAVTGGGSGAIAKLLARPGASATLLEAIVPYSAESLAAWIGHEPEGACCEPTARQMAMASFERARRLAEQVPVDRLLGVGATASLATNRTKRGEHRLHVAAQTSRQTVCLTVQLEKGYRSREEEEAFTSHAILALLTHAAGIRPIDLAKTPEGASATLAACEAPLAWSELLSGERDGVAIDRGEGVDLRGGLPRLVFPGSFNPLHEGHRKLAACCESITGESVWFELSQRNVDKPALDFLEIEQRIVPLQQARLLLTSAPTFVEKARLLPACTFAVGVDTIERVGQARYYADGAPGRDRAIAEIAALGCRFLVFGRNVEGEFQTVEDLALPKELVALCRGVTEQEFRYDLSSTSLRTESADAS